MPQNIEIKARYNGDLEDLKTEAKNLAGKEPLKLNQIDTFFQCSTGRLKLREIKVKGLLFLDFSKFWDFCFINEPDI